MLWKYRKISYKRKKMKVLDLEIGSDKWKEFRRTGIGASDSAVILGISPFKTPYQLWEEKINKKDSPVSFSMKRGLDREEEARFWFELEYGTILTPKVIAHPTIPWKYATLDGINDEGDIAVEIKFANHKVHEAAKKGYVIDYYYPQIQSQLECTGLSQMYFVSAYEIDNITEYQVVLVEKDPSFIQKMVEKEGQFYELLVANTPPPMTESDHYMPTDSFFFDHLCTLYQDIGTKIKSLQEERDEIKNQIKSLCEDKNCKTEKFTVTKYFSPGRLDSNLLLEATGIDLNNYRKEPSESWKITKNN